MLYFSCLNCYIGWYLYSRLWGWNGLPLNTYISLYTRTNRCSNERSSRTNYVRSSVPHCSCCVWLDWLWFLLSRTQHGWDILKHTLHCPAFWWRNMQHTLHRVSPKVNFRCKICETHSIDFTHQRHVPGWASSLWITKSKKLIYFCSQIKFYVHIKFFVIKVRALYSDVPPEWPVENTFQCECIRPASWSSGQSFWLLITRSQFRFPALPWEFSLWGEDPRGDHGLGS